MENIAVSIVCLAYNHERYIRETLEGFIKQKTNFKFEVLIHDDASTDKTADIIREYEQKYPDVIKPIYQTENQYSKKVSITWTYQYPRVQGKYIAFCEGDDYWCSETKLQEQFDVMEHNPDVVLCVHRVRGIKESGEETETLYPRSEICMQEGIIQTERLLNLLSNKYPFQTSSYFYRSSLIMKLMKDKPDYMGSLTHDMALMWSSALNGKVYFIDKENSKYRRGVPGSWTSQTQSEEFRMKHYKRLIEAYEAIDKYTNGKYHNLMQKNIREMEICIMQTGGNAKSLKDKAAVLIHKNKPLIYSVLTKYFKPLLKLILEYKGRHIR